MLALGTNDVMWGALQTGRVAATILSPPGTLFARKAGMNFMVDLTDLKLEYQGSTIATRRSLVQKIRRCHSGNCERSSKAFICLRPARKILCAFSVSSSAPVIARRWKNRGNMPRRCRPSPMPVESAVQAVLDHLAEGQPKFAQYRPADFIDARVLSEIDKSGYIDKLYGAHGIQGR